MIVQQEQPIIIQHAQQNFHQTMANRKKKVLRALSLANESEKQKNNLLDLPTELLLEIFPYLPLPSQVTLTLSSKGLYQLFNYVLKSK